MGVFQEIMLFVLFDMFLNSTKKVRQSAKISLYTPTLL